MKMIIRLHNGDSFMGSYVDDKKNGQGKELKKDGLRYIGHFLNDRKHGEGKHIWRDGTVYLGHYS